MSTSTKLTKVQVNTAALIQQIRLAPVIETAWLPVSYVMAHVEIESGFDAAVKAEDYATTGSIGLMQPEAVTAKTLLTRYATWISASGLKVTSDMTDPLSNLTVGMLDLYDMRNPMIARFGNPLAYAHLAVGYNKGQGAAEMLTLAQAQANIYYLQWASTQRNFAFLDTLNHAVTV